MRRPRLGEADRPGLWIGLAIGTPVMGWGVRGLLEDSARTHPAELARWIVGSAIVHDAVILPLVVVVAVAARRAAPPSVWPALRWALAASAVVLVVSRPFVSGVGRRPDNPSLLPRSYGVGVAIAVASIWLAAGGWAWWSVRRVSR